MIINSNTLLRHIRDYKQQNVIFVKQLLKLIIILKKSKLISKIGDKMNVCQKSGFITSNCNVYYYETEWIDKNHYFKFYLDYVCLETEIYQ